MRLMSVLGFIVWGNAHGSWRTPITDVDALWLGRMARGSAGTRDSGPVVAARFWIAAQRYVLQCDRDRFVGPSARTQIAPQPGRVCRWRSFSDSFRAYSTAIHAGWARGGAHCQPGGQGYGTVMCDERRLQRRERITSLSWADMGVELHDFVRAWASGRVGNPVPGMAHTGTIGEDAAPDDAITLPTSGNWYAPDRETARWPVGYVRIEPAASARAWVGPTVVIFGVVALGVAYWWTHER